MEFIGNSGAGVRIGYIRARDFLIRDPLWHGNFYALDMHSVLSVLCPLWSPSQKGWRMEPFLPWSTAVSDKDKSILVKDPKKGGGQTCLTCNVDRLIGDLLVLNVSLIAITIHYLMLIDTLSFDFVEHFKKGPKWSRFPISLWEDGASKDVELPISVGIFATEERLLWKSLKT